MFAEVAFTTESMVAIGVLLSALTGAVVKIFQLLMKAKDDQIALAMEMSKRKSFEDMLNDALVIMETRVVGKLEKSGQQPVKPLAAVVPESSSPPTHEQKVSADVATARARLTAVALAVGAPTREVAEKSPLPPGRPTPSAVVVEQLRQGVEEVGKKVDAVPEKVAEKLDERKSESPPPGAKP